MALPKTARTPHRRRHEAIPWSHLDRLICQNDMPIWDCASNRPHENPPSAWQWSVCERALDRPGICTWALHGDQVGIRIRLVRGFCLPLGMRIGQWAQCFPFNSTICMPFGQWRDWALGNRPPLSQEGRCGSSCRKSRAHPSNFRQKLCNLVLCSVVCECALWSKLRSALSDGFAIQGHCPGFMAQ